MPSFTVVRNTIKPHVFANATSLRWMTGSMWLGSTETFFALAIDSQEHRMQTCETTHYSALATPSIGVVCSRSRTPDYDRLLRKGSDQEHS